MEKLILAVSSHKGGVGKTTTSVNLATTFAIAGLQTLLIDLDSQANSSTQLKVSKAASWSDFSDLTELQQAQRPTAIANLNALHAAPVHEHHDSTQADITALRKTLTQAVAQVIVLDCPPAMSYSTLSALYASTDVVVPTTYEMFSLSGVLQTMETLQLLKSEYGFKGTMNGILLSNLRWKDCFEQRFRPSLFEHLQEYLYDTIIRHSSRIVEAQLCSVPLQSLNKTSKSAAEYAQLSTEILQRSKVRISAIT